jgi:hypothetical protein
MKKRGILASRKGGFIYPLSFPLLDEDGQIVRLRALRRRHLGKGEAPCFRVDSSSA